MEKTKINRIVTIRGRVQGVGFRYSAVNMAGALGIYGYTKNLYNGDVLVEVEGTVLAVEQMIKWCNDGPGTAHVENTYIKEGVVKNYNSFSVKY